MKLLTKLEKSRTFWYFLGFCLLFFFLRLPSLIEPNWYGDEGIYQVIGQAINSGRLLYTEIWDNKPPLLYIVYAMFNGDQFQVRLFSLVTGILAVGLFFNFARLLFKKIKAAIVATLFFVILFGIPMLEGNIANAENFMILPILTAGFIIYSCTQNRKLLILFAAGLLLGISFLFKIVAVFDFTAFCMYLLLLSYSGRFSFSAFRIKALLRASIISILPLLAGFLLPITLTVLYFLLNGAISDFIRASFSSNVGYVGWKNKFIIPQGFLIFKLLLLTSAVLILFLKRKKLTKPTAFIAIWFVFSFFNTYFSGRPYTHYALVMLSSLCLMIGLIIETVKPKLKLILFLILLCSIGLLNNTFKFNLNKTFRYYNNAISFMTGQKDIVSYQSFFDQKTPRDYEIASFIKTHTKPEDDIFIWGDSAQIYSLSGKIPPGRYTVAYHITQYKDALSETQNAIIKTKPKYIVVLIESRAFPLSIPSYDSKFVLRESIIYERSF